jgi:hypothetical protein
MRQDDDDEMSESFVGKKVVSVTDRLLVIWELDQCG